MVINQGGSACYYCYARLLVALFNFLGGPVLDQGKVVPVLQKSQGVASFHIFGSYEAIALKYPPTKLPLVLYGIAFYLESIADRLAEASRISASLISPSFLDLQTILSFDPNDVPVIVKP